MPLPTGHSSRGHRLFLAEFEGLGLLGLGVCAPPFLHRIRRGESVLNLMNTQCQKLQELKPVCLFLNGFFLGLTQRL